jgi:hypothetical protein
MFRYRLHSPDGDDLGEATYAQMIHPGDEIHVGAGQGLRVVDVVLCAEDDESPVRRAAEGRGSLGRGVDWATMTLGIEKSASKHGRRFWLLVAVGVWLIVCVVLVLLALL